MDHDLEMLKAMLDAFKKYRVFEEDGQFCVYDMKPDGSRGEQRGCHGSQGEADAQIAAIGAGAEGKGALEDCVHRKIPILVNEEGMDQDQAVAVAYSMCRKDPHAADKANGGELQTVIVPKSKAPTRDEATALVKGMGYSVHTSRETGDSWRFRQRPPEDFDDNYHTEKLDNGVSLVYGTLKDSEKMIAFGGAVKAIKGQPGRVGGYLVMWGTDGQRDLEGEYFTKDTDLGLDWYPTRPALYHHGLDKAVGGTRVGTIEEMTPDDTGVWVEAQLDLRNQYVQAVMGLVEKGALGWSSGTLPQLVRVEQGKIVAWPIVEGSLTPTPAEPRNAVVPLKALVDLPTLEGLTTSAAEAVSGGDAGVAAPDSPAAAASPAEAGAPVMPVDAPADPNAADPGGSPSGTSQTVVDADDPGAGGPPPGSPSSVPSTTTTPSLEGKRDDDMNPEAIVTLAVTDALQAAGVTNASDEDKKALIAAILAKVQSNQQQPPLEQTPPEQAKAVGEAIGKAALEIIQGWQTQRAAGKAAQDYLKTVQASMQPVSPVPTGFTAPRSTIEVRSKYHSLSAEDMSFAKMVIDGIRANEHRPRWEPGQAFFRELADKTAKAWDAGQMVLGDPAIKAITGIKADELDHSFNTYYGDEWVPTLWSDQLWEQARLDNLIFPLFQAIDMPSDPYTLPVSSTDPTVYHVAETQDEDDLLISGAGNPIPDSQVGTANTTLDTEKLALRVGFSSELEEDSIIPFSAQARKQALRAMEDALDNVILNADDTDTTNINYDSGSIVATSKYTIWANSLRHMWLVTTAANGKSAANGAPTLELLRQTRGLMAAALATKPTDLAWITHFEVYMKLLGLDEVVTVDKYGPGATVLNGELAKVDGIPIIVTAELPLTASNGKKHASTGNSYGSMTLVHRPSWIVGFRRRVKAALEYISYYDAYQLTVTMRPALAYNNADCAAGLYYIAV